MCCEKNTFKIYSLVYLDIEAQSRACQTSTVSLQPIIFYRSLEPFEVFD
jgi:hypothetical protein